MLEVVETALSSGSDVVLVDTTLVLVVETWSSSGTVTDVELIEDPSSTVEPVVLRAMALVVDEELDDDEDPSVESGPAKANPPISSTTTEAAPIHAVSRVNTISSFVDRVPHPRGSLVSESSGDR